MVIAYTPVTSMVRAHTRLNRNEEREGSSHTKLYQDSIHVYMINTQTLEKDKAKTYKSNPKAATFQRRIAASDGT